MLEKCNLTHACGRGRKSQTQKREGEKENIISDPRVEWHVAMPMHNCNTHKTFRTVFYSSTAVVNSDS